MLPSKNYNIDDYPTIKEYLLNNFGMEKLEQTGKTYIKDGKIIKSRKKTNNKWYETQDSISYWNDFNKQKILYSEIVQYPKFFLDNTFNYVPEATAFLMTGDNLEYLLMVLNSKLMFFVFKNYYAGGGLGEKGVRYKKAFLNKLPIPKQEDYMKFQKYYADLINGKYSDDDIDKMINEELMKKFKFNNDEKEYITAKIKGIEF